jgi:RHS repeat-associated protein
MGGAAGAKTKYQYNGIEHLDAFALNVNQAHYRTLDPTTGRWWGVDPFANSFKSLSPYCAMGNSPVVYTDPGGGFITWSVNNGGISIGFNLTPIGIPLGAGINVGWSNGGSVGAYGEVGYRVGGTGLGAGATVMVGVDYSIANNTTSGSVGFQAYGSFGPGFAGGSISTNGWSVNAGIGVGNAKSGVGFGVGYGSDGFTYGISGYSGGSGSKKRADSGPDDDIARRSNRGPNAGKDPAWDPQPAEVSKVQPDGGLDLEQAARTGLYDGPLSDPNAFGSGQSSVRNGYLAGRNHPITGVPFDLNGFPNFKDHLHPSLPNNVYITPTGNRAKDFAAANAQANIPFTPKHYVWHHHQEYGRMQLVRQSVHQKTGHTGGFHLWRKN